MLSKQKKRIRSKRDTDVVERGQPSGMGEKQSGARLTQRSKGHVGSENKEFRWKRKVQVREKNLSQTRKGRAQH